MAKKPLVNIKEDETVLEWWHGNKKLSLYFEYDPPSISYVAMDGSNFIDPDPKHSSIETAFMWLWD